MRLTPGRRAVYLGEEEWTPAKLNPVLWLEADRGTWQDSVGGTVAVSGDAVGAWQDLSGNGNHATQAVASGRPILTTASNGGKNFNAVDFDGVGTFLATTTFAAELAQPTTLYFVLSAPSVVTDGYLWDGSVATGRNAGWTTGLGTALSIYAGSVVTPGPPYLDVTAWCSISVCYNGASSWLYRNSVAFPGGDVGADGLDGLVIGARFDGTQPSDFVCSFVCVVNNENTERDRDNMLRYLARKYGIALT